MHEKFTAKEINEIKEQNPGIVVIESEESGLAPEILAVMLMGFASFVLLFAGLAILTDTLHRMESRLSHLQHQLDEGAVH